MPKKDFDKIEKDFRDDMKIWDKLINQHENTIYDLINKKELCNSSGHKGDEHYLKNRIEQEKKVVRRLKNQRQNRISTYESAAGPAAAETE